MEELLDKVICGDSLEIMANIPDDSIHLAITSPPYNLDINYDVYKDNIAYVEYLNWAKKVWVETKRVLVPGGRFALNIAPTSIKNFRPIHHDFANQLREMGMIFRTEIVWYKQTMRRRTAWGSWKTPANPHIVPSWEYVLVFCKDKWQLLGDPAYSDITQEEFMHFSDGFWYIPPAPQRRGHPTPFPEELVYRLIKFYTYKGNTVLDMFGGTGTVAVVAQRTGRHFIHIDISQQYCDTAERRLEAARAEQELPFSVGRPGRKTKVSTLFAAGVERHTAKPKPKQLEPSRLLESQKSYEHSTSATDAKVEARDA